MPRLTRHHAHWPPGVPRTLSSPGRTLWGSLAAQAEAQPDGVAIDYYGRSTSYRALHQSSLCLAGYLQQRLGVERGDRVVLMMQNCPQFVVAYYAILRADAAVVAISPMSTADEVAYYVQDCGARLMIATQDMLEAIRPLLADRRLAGCIVGAYAEHAGEGDWFRGDAIPAFALEPRRPAAGPGEHDFGAALAAAIAPAPAAAGGNDLAAIAYTSGTSGRPKGAMLSRRAVELATAQRSRWLADGTQRADLISVPMCHIAGMSSMHQAIHDGRTSVLLARWDAGLVPGLIERHRIGRWAAVAPMLADLLASPELDRHDLSSLTRLYAGATAVPAALSTQVERRLGISVIECYGMTEMCGSTHINPPQATRRQSGGIAQIDVDARVIDPDSGAELGPNRAGEIVLTGPTQFDGYWNQPDATRAALIEIDGQRFFRSGDIGHYDDDGYFYVTDRIKRMINASGLKVWPGEVEMQLCAHPDVAEACVIAARDDVRGETVKALIVPKAPAQGTLTAADVTDWARTRMAAYKVPRAIEFVDELPKTAAGKVRWRVLQDEQRRRDAERRASDAAAAGAPPLAMGRS